MLLKREREKETIAHEVSTYKLIISFDIIYLCEHFTRTTQLRNKQLRIFSHENWSLYAI